MSSQCRMAALRAYREMAASGERSDRAYETAVQVFRHYHPERSRIEAFQIVADWLENEENGFEADRIED